MNMRAHIMTHIHSLCRTSGAQRGFTVIESIVAIALFTVGVSAAVALITQSINVGTRTRDKIIAVHLAEEGIEVIRNIRDRNWLAGRPWVQGINALSNACLQWDSDSTTIDTACASGAYLAVFGGYYAQTTAPSQFSRRVTTQYFPVGTPNPGDPERLRVTATVTCGANCSIALDDYLYNWK